MKIYSMVLLIYFMLNFLKQFMKDKKKRNIFYIALLIPILLEVIK